ncbi:MAG: beta-propeller domain-containing protein [Oscillospiraceae bacterium]|nr:beta-propeller domain-containing protein [Oscillospiraceae bacterium]
MKILNKKSFHQRKRDPKSDDPGRELASLRETLAPLDARCPMPGELRAEHVLARAKAPRVTSLRLPRRAAAALAAVALLVTTGFVADKYSLFTRNNLKSLPEASPAAEGHFEPLSSYFELEQAFVRLQKNQERTRFYDGFKSVFDGSILEDWNWDAEEMTMPASEAPMESGKRFNASAAAGSDELRGHGETNTQVRGVDEADILKNDGKYLYYISTLNGEPGNAPRSALHILEALPAGEMRLLSKISIPNYRYDTQLYVQGDQLALVYAEYPPGGDPCASVQVYDIANREKPLLAHSFSQKGNLVSSRMQNGRVYLLSTQGANLDFRVLDGVIPEDEILPKLYENGVEACLPADRIAILPESDEPSYLLLSSVELQGGAKRQSESVAVLGAGSQVYCNTEALYVACAQYAAITGARGFWSGAGEKTLIYRFDLLSDGRIKPGPMGEVKGTPLNQFSMDEFEGHFRVVTTAPDEKDGTVNILTILDKSLKKVGGIEGIAPGERVQSARFLGEKGYIVTFRQTDPLFVIDLSNPRAPKILGELKLPGFSAYLHPWDAAHLVGVGPDGDEWGTNGGTKISLFNISDPANPKEVDRVIIPDSGTNIQQDHKAFVVCAEKNTFGLPVDHYNEYGVASSFHTFKVEGGKISKDLALEAAEPALKRHESVYGGYAEPRRVTRATYIGETWYVFGAQNSLGAYGMADGRELGRLSF